MRLTTFAAGCREQDLLKLSHLAPHAAPIEKSMNAADGPDHSSGKRPRLANRLPFRCLAHGA
jgi:hypothetical protein